MKNSGDRPRILLEDSSNPLPQEQQRELRHYKPAFRCSDSFIQPATASQRSRSPPSWGSLCLFREVVHDALKGIKSERLPDRRTEVGIRVHIVEDLSPIGCLQVFNPTDIQTAGHHD